MFKIIGNGIFGTALQHIIKNSDLTISDLNYKFLIPAVPSYAIPDVLNKESKLRDKHIIFVSKGFLENGQLIGEWADQQKLRWSVFAGPHFASELTQNLETWSIFGSDHKIDEIMQLKNMNVQFSKYKLEIQLLGILKNIYACFFGIIDGLQLGKNFAASMFTFVIQEIKQIFIQLNFNQEIIYSHAGIGDLILTCTSTQSRNYQEGLHRVVEIENHNLSEAKHSAIAFLKRFPNQQCICTFVGQIMLYDLKGNRLRKMFTDFIQNYRVKQ